MPGSDLHFFQIRLLLFGHPRPDPERGGFPNSEDGTRNSEARHKRLKIDNRKLKIGIGDLLAECYIRFNNALPDDIKKGISI